MSKYLKLKTQDGERVLVNADSIAYVNEDGSRAIVTIKYTGEELRVQEGYQTLVNRLTKDDE